MNLMGRAYTKVLDEGSCRRFGRRFSPTVLSPRFDGGSTLGFAMVLHEPSERTFGEPLPRTLVENPRPESATPANDSRTAAAKRGCATESATRDASGSTASTAASWRKSPTMRRSESAWRAGFSLVRRTRLIWLRIEAPCATAGSLGLRLLIEAVFERASVTTAGIAIARWLKSVRVASSSVEFRGRSRRLRRIDHRKNKKIGKTKTSGSRPRPEAAVNGEIHRNDESRSVAELSSVPANLIVHLRRLCLRDREPPYLRHLRHLRMHFQSVLSVSSAPTSYETTQTARSFKFRRTTRSKR